MKFTKMHGLGNDYIYINGFEEGVEHPEKLAIQLSDRHFGIGGDGIILINPSKVADFEMAMYNSDGSRGEMCGNGIRCVGKYVYDRGMTNGRHITVETLGGIRQLELLVEEGQVERVMVDMGAPVLTPSLIPVVAEGNHCINEPITVGGRQYAMTCVSMGNPHGVVYVDDLAGLDLEHLGPLFEGHSRFPNRINTEFVHVVDENRIRLRVWERGAGETLACGTGACGAVVASVLNGYTQPKVTVELLGGELDVEWNREENTVLMTGPANFVFDGEIQLGIG